MPDERAGNGGQERKPRSEEKRRRRERTRGEGDSTGLRHENERLQRRNERLRRENDRLKRKTDHLEKQLAAARRAGFRQAAPFAKDRPQGRGGHPGRRAGAAYGRQASRPRPAQVDEHYAASAPAACPDCGGAVAVTRVASQYQEELPVVRPVVRRFDIEVGHCSQCQRRVQVRNIRRGAVPRVDTFEALCQVLGLELQLGPALSGPDDEDALRHRSPPRFSGSRELPVYEWSNRSEEGYLRVREGSSVAPAPEELLDEQAFYVRMPDHSMVPARIWKGDYCLVSPVCPASGRPAGMVPAPIGPRDDQVGDANLSCRIRPGGLGPR